MPDPVHKRYFTHVLCRTAESTPTYSFRGSAFALIETQCGIGMFYIEQMLPAITNAYIRYTYIHGKCIADSYCDRYDRPPSPAVCHHEPGDSIAASSAAARPEPSRL